MTTLIQHKMEEIWANLFLLKGLLHKLTQAKTRMLINLRWVRLEPVRKEDSMITQETLLWLVNNWINNNLHISRTTTIIPSCSNRTSKMYPATLHQVSLICNPCKSMDLDIYRKITQMWWLNNRTIECKMCLLRLVRTKMHLPLKIWYNNSNTLHNQIKSNKLKKFLLKTQLKTWWVCKLQMKLTKL